ncbi:MAG TPA: class F sortase [Acidimicrobiales bacterium]|nr:class F sortase [Acidimicrobiales bacterium]
MRRRAVAVLAVVAAGTAGCSASASVVVASRRDVTPPPPVVGTAPAPTATTIVSPTATTTVATTPPPATPAITSHAAQLDQLPAPATRVPVGVTAGGDIDGPVIPTGVDSDTGELALPPEAKVVAWYQYGPAPGGEGSAVLAGHVDWHGEPGIFFRLRELRPGDGVTVTMSDGSMQAWTVVDVQLIDKPLLRVSDVFSRTGPPTLTLVTCGGSFDRSTHHYRSNVVVTAIPV